MTATASGGAREPIFELRGLTRHFGDVVAVDGVDLALAQGEFVSFLGPSGSGKTTTLMMVAGLLAPTRGQILLRGQDLAPMPPHRRNIGMVFQNYALFPHLSVAANVAFPLEMRRVKRAEIERRVRDALALVGLPDHGARLPAQLSGGQQQRVALARALVYEPPLLLMDEPLGALDKNLREQMQLEISRLHRELRMTVLYVTHDQEEALIMSDRIAVFNGGRIEQVGRPREVYERPATRFVAGFVGESSFIAGRVTSIADGIATLETAHGVLRGHAAGVVPGALAVLAVRPERIALASAENALRARLAEVIYFGDSYKLIARLPDGTELSGRLPLGGADALEEGAEVTLGWHPAACNVLPACSYPARQRLLPEARKRAVAARMGHARLGDRAARPRRHRGARPPARAPAARGRRGAAGRPARRRQDRLRPRAAAGAGRRSRTRGAEPELHPGAELRDAARHDPSFRPVAPGRSGGAGGAGVGGGAGRHRGGGMAGPAGARCVLPVR